MNDQEIRSLLLKIDDEQQKEAELRQPRAWAGLRGRLYGNAETGWSFGWVTGGALAGVAIAVCAVWMMPAVIGGQSPRAVAQAEQSGLAVSSFYSPEAQADVVWISGLSSASDEGNMQ